MSQVILEKSMSPEQIYNKAPVFLGTMQVQDVTAMRKLAAFMLVCSALRDGKVLVLDPKARCTLRYNGRALSYLSEDVTANCNVREGSDMHTLICLAILEIRGAGDYGLGFMDEPKAANPSSNVRCEDRENQQVI